MSSEPNPAVCWNKGAGGELLLNRAVLTHCLSSPNRYRHSTSNAMVIAMPGKGSQYLIGLRDADGNFLTGEYAYRVHLPANMPVANYWSVVLYDADTRALLDNGEPFPSVASNQQMTFNQDGSADVYFGPETPNDQAANWIKTVPGRGYFVGMRLYSPTQAFFDQSWKPDNIVKMD